MVRGPIETLFTIIATTWEVLVLGTLQAIPALLKWLIDGTWLMVATKLGVAFMLSVGARSLWYKMADGQDSSPLTTTGLVAVGLLILLCALIANAMGMWPSFRRMF